MDALNKGPQHLSLGRGRLDLQRSIAAARQAAEKRNSNGLPQARFRAATAGELLRDEAQYVSPSVRNRRAATIPLTLAQEVEAATSQYAGDSRKGLGADRALRGLIRASSERRIPAASVEIPSLNQWAEGELAIESDADGVARAKALITAAYIDIQGSTGPKPIQLNLSGLGLQSFPPLDFLRRQGVTLRIDLSDNEIQYFPLARDFFSPLRHHLRRVNVDGNPINSLIFDLSSKRMLQIMNLKGRKIQIRLPESQFGAAWTRLGFIQRNFTFLEPREDSDSDGDGGDEAF